MRGISWCKIRGCLIGDLEAPARQGRRNKISNILMSQHLSNLTTRLTTRRGGQADGDKLDMVPNGWRFSMTLIQWSTGMPCKASKVSLDGWGKSRTHKKEQCSVHSRWAESHNTIMVGMGRRVKAAGAYLLEGCRQCTVQLIRMLVPE
jgi:hypothetical protein